MEDHLVSPVPSGAFKTDLLEGAALDAAVAKAEGLAFAVEKHLTNPPNPMACWVMVYGKPDFANGPYAPSTRWGHGGPIIERERISLLPPGYGGGSQWTAGIGGRNDYDGWEADFMADGPTPLIAAMRAFVRAAGVRAQTPKAET